MPIIDFANDRGQNLADPKYDKDAVNLRTLRRQAVIITGGTAASSLWTGDTGLYSIISKNGGHSAGGSYSIVAGGLNNTISNDSTSSGIFGGTSNNITNNVLNTVIVGGLNITASQNNSLYTQNARLAENGGIIYSAGTPLQNIFALAGSDTNTFITSFVYDNANKFTITRNDAVSFDAVINTVTGLTVNGDLDATNILSGGTDLSEIFGAGDITRVQSGINTFTAGTVNEPSVNVTALTVDSISVSGESSFNTLSANTIYSGSTDLSDIFSTSNNFVTGFTYDNANNLTVSVNDGNNYVATLNEFSGLTVNGSLSAITMSAVTFVGGDFVGEDISVTTIFSGGTNLSELFVAGSGTVNYIPIWNGTQSLGDSIMYYDGVSGITVDGSVYITGNVEVLGTATTINTQDLAVVDNTILLNSGGTHLSAFEGGIYIQNGVSAGTDSSWTIDGDGNWSANTSIISQGIDVQSGIMSSGGTDLYDIFLTTADGNDITRVQPGTNITTGGTPNEPIVSLADDVVINSISATTISGGTIYSGSTDLSDIFVTNNQLTATTLNDLLDVETQLPVSPTAADDGRMLFYDFDVNLWVSDDTVNHGTVVINTRSDEGVTIDKGTPVYLTGGFVDDVHLVGIADADDPTKMPVIGFAGEDILTTGSKHVITFGKLQGVDTTSGGAISGGESWSAGTILYISTTGGTLTQYRPTGSNTQIQRIAQVLRVDNTGGQLFVFNTARSAGLPNLTDGYVWLGNSNNQPEQVLFSSLDTSVTGFTYDGLNNFTISVSDGNDYTAGIDTMSGLTINGDLNVYGQSVFSGTGTDVVTIYGSGDTTPVFSVQGSSGELFSVTDSLTGSLFSVNDISGLPILEVFDDDTILMGSYAAPSLNTTAKVTANSGQTTVYSIPASAYTGAFFDYTVVNAIGARSGNVMAIWSGTSNIEFSETSTTDIGNSSDLTFDVAISGTDVLFRASANTDSWTVKSIVRSI
jgi:hypothetical protein